MTTNIIDGVEWAYYAQEGQIVYRDEGSDDWLFGGWVDHDLPIEIEGYLTLDNLPEIDIEEM